MNEGINALDLSIYVEKLYQMWIKHKNIRILVDYDDTIKPYNTASEYLCKVVINTLIEAKKLGATIVLWTCRSGTRLNEALKYCESIGLEFTEVNPTTPFLPEQSTKAYGNILLDDKAGLEQALTTLQFTIDKYKKFVYETNKKQRL